jgi:hypothetical protein
MKPPPDGACAILDGAGRVALWDDDVPPADPIIFK